MTDENPYEPPSREAVQVELPKPLIGRRPLAAIIVVLAAVATGMTFYLPMVAVPAALVLLPTALRVIRVRAVRYSNQATLDGWEHAMLLLISVLAAIPIGFASLILFCCVCTPTGLVTSEVIGSAGYGPNGPALATAIFLGMLVALWFGQFVLRRLGFLSQEVKDAMRRGSSS